jgi:hypothetical protein
MLIIEKDVHRTDRTITPFMEEDLPHPDPESQYSGTNAHLEMLKDMLMTYNMYDQKKVGMSPKVFFPSWSQVLSSCLRFSALCPACRSSKFMFSLLFGLLVFCVLGQLANYRICPRDE